MNGLLKIAFLVSLVLSIAPPLHSDELSNQQLIDAALKAQTLLSQIESTGDTFVLPADYFLDAFQFEYEVLDSDFDTATKKWVPAKGEAPAKKPLTATVNKMVVCFAIAEGMLEVAKPDLQNPSEYLVSWDKKKSELMQRVARISDIHIFETDMERQAWDKFLETWKQDVTKVDVVRFRDALRQAAYSILRVGINKEKELVDLVKRGAATPSGGGPSTLATSSSSGTTYTGSAHLSDVIHHRLMNHIYHTHDRRTNRITRIISRR